MVKTLIAIPSYGRYNNVGALPLYCTATYVSDSYWPNTIYYVEREEYRQYQEAFKCINKRPQLVTSNRCDKPKMWGSIMDLIIDECVQECDHLVIMDDDLRIAVRPKLISHPEQCVRLRDGDFDDMIRRLRKVTSYDMPLTSIQYRQFCHTKNSKVNHNQRISMIWSLDSRFFRTHKQYRFYRKSKLDFMTDYYFFLSLMKDGYDNLCINRYTKDDHPNAEGGEKSKRQLDVFNKAVRKFADMFPGYVTVRQKKQRNHWDDGMAGVTIRIAKLLKERA